MVIHFPSNALLALSLKKFSKALKHFNVFCHVHHHQLQAIFVKVSQLLLLNIQDFQMK
jgi:hypothetical protein